MNGRVVAVFLLNAALAAAVLVVVTRGLGPAIVPIALVVAGLLTWWDVRRNPR